MLVFKAFHNSPLTMLLFPSTSPYLKKLSSLQNFQSLLKATRKLPLSKKSF